MDVLHRKPAFRSLQGAPAGDLCLRIVGTAREGQMVRLTSRKCTIGSAKGCSLRLRAAGVRPMHCLVLRGSRGTVVRSWAPNTRLNGHTFCDATLVEGDRLKVGSIEFEVVAQCALVQSAGDSGPQSTEVSKLSSATQQVQVLRRRARTLIGAVRDLQAEVVRLSHCEKSESNRTNDLQHGI